MSTLFYTARYMELPEGADLKQYKEKRDEICSRNWNQV